MKPILFCVLYVVGALAGDVGLALWAKGRAWPWLAGAMATHAIASAMWAGAMRAGLDFGRSAAILILANLGGTVLIARFGFEEPLTTQHLVGLILAALAIVLLA
jgi:hypothetical protein